MQPTFAVFARWTDKLGHFIYAVAYFGAGVSELLVADRFKILSRLLDQMVDIVLGVKRRNADGQAGYCGACRHDLLKKRAIAVNESACWQKGAHHKLLSIAGWRDFMSRAWTGRAEDCRRQNA